MICNTYRQAEIRLLMNITMIVSVSENIYISIVKKSAPYDALFLYTSILWGNFKKYYSTVIVSSSVVLKLTVIALVHDWISSVNSERSLWEATMRCANSVHNHNCFSVLYPRTFSITISSSSTATVMVVKSFEIGKTSLLGKDKR